VAVEAWRRLTAASLAATRVPDGFRRVPTEFRPPRTCPWHESEFRGAEPLPRHGEGLKRDRMGLSRNRGPSGSSRMGTKWGLGPFTI
jgi:hypothetical protein